MKSFKDLGLNASLLRTVESEGYTNPTPIQEKAIPILLEGKDLLGCAQTGTGKTAAFALPIIHRLCMSKRPEGKRQIRVLVITPTRELASQIYESFATYGKGSGLTQLVVFGGVNQNPQSAALRRGVDILVATPGRLLDLTAQGFVSYSHLEYFVLDEADRMLDMGFINDVKKIIKALPQKRQTLLFSATMPREIRELSNTILKNAIQVDVAPPATTAERVKQSIYMVEKPNKTKLLGHLLKSDDLKRVLIFTRTKHGANKVVKQLMQFNVDAAAIHGNKSQAAREKALQDFKNGTIRVMVATDIASRGIDVDNVSHVINYDLPNEPESYVHRIGRTARAGAEGIAISFCDSEERAYLRDIEKLINQQIHKEEDNPYKSFMPAAAPSNKPSRSQQPVNRGNKYQPKQPYRSNSKTATSWKPSA